MLSTKAAVSSFCSKDKRKQKYSRSQNTEQTDQNLKISSSILGH